MLHSNAFYASLRDIFDINIWNCANLIVMIIRQGYLGERNNW